MRNKHKKEDKYFDLFLLRVTQGENVLESERDFPYIWWQHYRSTQWLCRFSGKWGGLSVHISTRTGKLPVHVQGKTAYFKVFIIKLILFFRLSIIRFWCYKAPSLEASYVICWDKPREWMFFVFSVWRFWDDFPFQINSRILMVYSWWEEN